ncbi:unnamed protein product [Lampetra fluviatilis]
MVTQGIVALCRREATEELDRRRRSAAVETERREGQQREQSRGADAASRLDAFLLDKNKRRQADELWLRARSKQESSRQRQRAEGFETLCEYEAAVAQIGKIIAEREAHEDVAKTGGEANVKLAGVSVDKPRDGPFPGGVAVRRRGSVAPVHGGPTPVRRRASVMLTEPAQGSTPLSLGEKERGSPVRARHHHNGRASWSNDLRLNADFIHDTYVDRENANFALFNYVTEQECEIRKLKDDIEKLSADMEPRGGGPEGTSEEREKAVRVNICKVTSEKEMSEKKRADAEGTLSKLKEGVWNLLMKMDCNLEELKQGLAWKEGVTDQNIAAYLILIKQEASRLLSARDYLQSKHQQQQHQQQQHQQQQHQQQQHQQQQHQQQQHQQQQHQQQQHQQQQHQQQQHQQQQHQQQQHQQQQHQQQQHQQQQHQQQQHQQQQHQQQQHQQQQHQQQQHQQQQHQQQQHQQQQHQQQQHQQQQHQQQQHQQQQRPTGRRPRGRPRTTLLLLLAGRCRSAGLGTPGSSPGKARVCA